MDIKISVSLKDGDLQPNLVYAISGELEEIENKYVTGYQPSCKYSIVHLHVLFKTFSLKASSKL